MTDWPVMSKEDVVPYLKAKYPHMYQGNDEAWCRQREDTLLSALDTYDTELLLEAQAQLLGGLADAVIVWMCYFAQRQERERIERLFNGTIELCLSMMLEEASNAGDTPEAMTVILAKRIKGELSIVLWGDKGE